MDLDDLNNVFTFSLEMIINPLNFILDVSSVRLLENRTANRSAFEREPSDGKVSMGQSRVPITFRRKGF
jgi:hypothetical protein